MTLYRHHTDSAKPRTKQLLLCSITLLALALLAGCESTPKQPDSDQVQQQDLRDPAPLVQLAQTSSSPEKDQYLLEAADILAQQNDSAWARNLLASIEPEQLNDSSFIQYTQLYSRLSLEEDAYFLAQRILTEPRLEQQWMKISVADAAELRERRAQVFIILGEVELSVHERMTLEPYLDDQALHNSNQNAIWQALMTIPTPELERRAESESNPELRAWYQLANLNKHNLGDLSLQQKKIEQWQQAWPDHPASQKLPDDLQLIKQLIANTPKQVALLLPTTGKLSKAGRAIRDGFFSAYYQSQKDGAWTPNIRIYDSGENSGPELYQRAQRDGADIVIGPLSKGEVANLAAIENLTTPILSLNYLEKHNAGDATQQQLPSALYQFGLAVEGEAAQTAQRAWLEGHRRAMIITPDASWGQRSADAFAAKWQELGGEIVGINRFTGKGDYSKVIETALQIDSSKARARTIQNMFGHTMEFEPRRRQDLDMIFLIARPDQARQIKPTLAFHYAGSVPVFATSHIYSGKQDRKSDRDLNGIKFSTLPWLFDQTSPEKQTIETLRNSPASYARLYALGVDAYRLYPRLQQLQDVPGTRFYGATGALELLDDQRILRQQVWAQIQSGRAKPLPAVVTDSL